MTLIGISKGRKKLSIKIKDDDKVINLVKLFYNDNIFS